MKTITFQCPSLKHLFNSGEHRCLNDKFEPIRDKKKRNIFENALILCQNSGCDAQIKFQNTNDFSKDVYT